MAHSSSNSGEFVCRHACSHAAAANQHTSFRLAIQDGAPYCFSEVRVIRGVFIECTDVQNIVSQGPQQIARGHLQLKSCVVRTNDKLHRRLTFRALPLRLLPRCPLRSQTSSANLSAEPTRRNSACR